MDEPTTQKFHITPSPAAEDDEQFRAAQDRIKEMIAANAPLAEILSSLVLMIEGQSPEMLGSVLLISADGNHVWNVVAPSLPSSYTRAIDGAPIGPKEGSCGTAMYRGKPVIVSDISTDQLWENYREYAAAAGLRACWSTPIMSSKGKVLGSFAMYYRDPRTPTGTETHLTNVATRSEEYTSELKYPCNLVCRLLIVNKYISDILHDIDCIT